MDSSIVTGIKIDLIAADEAIGIIFDAARNRSPLGVALLAVHPMVTALNDDKFRFRLNQLGLRLVDGWPLLLISRWLAKNSTARRIRGHSLMKAILQLAAKEHLSVFLFGGRAESLSILERDLPQRYPGLIVAGCLPGRYEKLSEEEHRSNVEKIVTSGADIVLVGLGSPRQETWIFENQQSLSRPLIGMGAAFDYESGLLRPPPAIIQNLGVEWLWRLVRDPRRLWRRYLIGAPYFFLFVVLQLLGLFEIRDRGASPKEPVYYG